MDNYDHYKDMNVLEFLTNVGKNFPLAMMLNKQSVSSRLASENGISFTEFSYQILQAYDFYTLNKSHGCILQLGGSDQWGNITAGVDFTRRVSGNQVYGLTTPLLLASNGEKFGKSAGNALFIDPEDSQSLLSIHQYIMGLSDQEIGPLLRLITFMPMEEVLQIEERISNKA